MCLCCAVLSCSVGSYFLWPHRRQPTRLRHPWDFPGKNTGVGCHFLLQCKKVKSESEVAQSCPTLCDPRDCSPPSSSVRGILQARVLEWVAMAFSQGIFLTQGSNLGLPHCKQFLYHLSHQGSPKVSLVILMRWVLEHLRMRAGGQENQSGLTLSLPLSCPHPPTSVKGTGPKGWILH